MIRAIKRLRRLKQDITHFGIAGIFLSESKLLSQLGQWTGKIVANSLQISVPGETRPAYIRLGTSDADVFRQVYLEQQYKISGFHNQFVQSIYETILGRGEIPLIIDCGANNGAAARYFASKYPAASVHAIEPALDNCRMLRRNVEGFERVKIWHAGVSSEAGHLSIIEPTAEAWAIQTERASEAIADAIQAIDIPTILQTEPRGRLFVAKIDIEGFEEDLFKSNTAWVAECPVVYIEPHDWLFPGQGTSRNFQGVMAATQRDILLSGENLIWIDTKAMDRYGLTRT